MRKRVQVEVCDNPECDVEVPVLDGVVMGYLITKGALNNQWGGGPIPRTFACSIACLPLAVEARIDEEWG